VLGVRERRGLARRTARHNAIDAALDLPFDMIAQGALVDFAVAKRRDDRR